MPAVALSGPRFTTLPGPTAIVPVFVQPAHGEDAAVDRLRLPVFVKLVAALIVTVRPLVWLEISPRQQRHRRRKIVAMPIWPLPPKPGVVRITPVAPIVTVPPVHPHEPRVDRAPSRGIVPSIVAPGKSRSRCSEFRQMRRLKPRPGPIRVTAMTAVKLSPFTVTPLNRLVLFAVMSRIAPSAKARRAAADRPTGQVPRTGRGWLSVSVLAVLLSVPVRFTVPPLLVKVPSPAVVKVPSVERARQVDRTAVLRCR